MKRVLCLLLFFVPSLVWSCSCKPPDPPKKSLATVDAVFVGKVVQVVEGKKDVFPRKTVVLVVSTVWKGKLTKELSLTTGIGGGDCGYRFEEGKSYLIYAYGDVKKGMSTNICTRTRPLERAAMDLRALGKGNEVPADG